MACAPSAAQPANGGTVARRHGGDSLGTFWGLSGDALGTLSDAMATLWGRSGDALGTLWHALGTLWGRSGDALGTLWDALAMLWDALGTLSAFQIPKLSQQRTPKAYLQIH